MTVYEVSGRCWSVSVQRWRPGLTRDNVSPHGGALPCHLLEGSAQARHVIVPLPQTEAVWIAFTLGPNAVVAGRAGNGRTCKKSLLAELEAGRRIELIDGVLDERGLAEPIGEASLGVARSTQELNRPQLVFQITDGRAVTLTSSLSISLVTPELYSFVSGEPAPSPFSPDDVYGGWRLP